MGAESFGAGGGERQEAWFLQLRRSKPPLDGTWQPVMGHIEQQGGSTGAAIEPAPRCAIREAREEIGLEIPSGDALGFWALEQVHPFYIAAIECIVMSPRFAVEVRAGWTPKLNHEHTAHRWVRARDVGHAFVWPGQRAAVREIVDHLLPEASLSREHLRIRV
jgi:dATP pyrophosphohydrolase